MIIEYQKEELGNFIPYEINGNALMFNDKLMVKLDKYERDAAAHYDVCLDKFGSLVMGVIPGVAELYAAQIDIPARQYIEVDSGKTDIDGNEIFIPTPVPFDPANTTLTLWGQEG